MSWTVCCHDSPGSISGKKAASGSFHLALRQDVANSLGPQIHGESKAHVRGHRRGRRRGALLAVRQRSPPRPLLGSPGFRCEQPCSGAPGPCPGAAPPASARPPPPRPACSPQFQNGLAPRAGPARTPAVSQARAGWVGSGLGSARGLTGAPVEPPKGVGHQQPTCPWTWTPLLGPGANGPLLFKPGCVKLLSPLTGSVSATTTPWAALSRAGMRWHGHPPQGPPSPLAKHRQLP